MRAFQLNEERRLEYVESATPEPGPGEVRLSVRGASLNHRELWIAKGLYPGMKLPSILGSDGAGVVDAVGEGVDSEVVGKEAVCYPGLGWGDDPRAPTAAFRIFGMPEPGFFAEFACVPAESLVAVPRHLDLHEAAAFPVAGLTAWRGLVRHGEVGPGSRVLVTGIGGGVAQFGLLFARALGAEVFVTSSSPAKIEKAIEEGARAGLDYRSEEWGRELASLSGGIDVVLDGAPPRSFETYRPFLNLGARVVVYGASGGFETTLHVPRFFLLHAALVGTALGTLAEFRSMLRFVEERELRPQVSRTFPFGEIPAALEYLASGEQIGKVTLDRFPGA